MDRAEAVASRPFSIVLSLLDEKSSGRGGWELMEQAVIGHHVPLWCAGKVAYKQETEEDVRVQSLSAFSLEVGTLVGTGAKTQQSPISVATCSAIHSHTQLFTRVLGCELGSSCARASTLTHRSISPISRNSTSCFKPYRRI